MGKIWQPQPFEVLQNWIDTIIEEAEDKLTDWERTFVTDMGMRVANHWQLSERQEAALERIYADKTS